jgi:hypothetical protein
MASRLELHDEFIDILGTRNESESRVYFQPPESIKMKYRCIRYTKSEPNLERANNKVYLNTSRYDGVVIDYDPDCEIPNKLLEHFQMCSLGKPYTSNGLNHFPFTIYY